MSSRAIGGNEANIQLAIRTLGDMLLDFTYQEGIHMKVGHFNLKDQQLTSSCFVRYSVVIVHGGTEWITSDRVLREMEWRSTAEETRDLAR